ncbi:hypothetical protein PF008_g13582, partial [Phytophthora fragariae]
MRATCQRPYRLCLLFMLCVSLSPPRRALRSPPGSASRRSNRYSPYRSEAPEPRSSRSILASPAVTRRVMFSPQQDSPTSAYSPPPPVPVASPRQSTPAQSSSTTTSARLPRTPHTPKSSTPTGPPV